MEDVDGSSSSSGGILTPQPINLVSIQPPGLSVEYDPFNRVVIASYGNYLYSRATMVLNDWTTVRLALKPSTLEMDLELCDAEGKCSPGVLQSRIFGPLLPLSTSPGVTVGPSDPALHTITSLSVVQRDSPLKRSRRGLGDDSEYTYNRGSNVSALNFEGSNGYVSYDFRNRIRLARPGTVPDTGTEEVALDFVLRRGVTSGLLWFAEGPTSKSYIIIKVSPRLG